MFDLKETPLSGCFVITPRRLDDNRGYFQKTFLKSEFEKLDLATEFAEEYFSLSRKNVIRGLHFQKPPADHAKVVSCLVGEVEDAVVDLRVSSNTFGKHFLIRLSEDKPEMLYIPSGLAHGFGVLSRTALLHYKVTTEYDSNLDDGVLWNSCNIPWSAKNPVLSKRDTQFQALSDYKSPF